MTKLYSYFVCAFCMIFFSQNSFSQVGIGTTIPNSDAILDVNSTTGGLLLPRLALTATTNPTPLTTDVAGMIVYNTATAGDVTPGFYYNDGTDWIRLGGGSTSVGWGLTGNAGTTYDTNFLGTTDNVDLAIKRNNQMKIRVENTSTTFANEIRTRDGGADTGDVLVHIYDSADDGVIEVHENNAMSHRIHGNGETIFNEQALDLDFRIESAGVENMFLVDGSANQILLNTPGAGSHPYPDPFVAYTNFVLPSGSTTNSFAVTGWNSGDTGGGGNFQNTNPATGFSAMEASTVGIGNGVTGSAFGPAGSTGAGVSGQSSQSEGVRGLTVGGGTAGSDFDLNNNRGVWGTLSYGTVGTSNLSYSAGVLGTVGDGGALTNYAVRTAGVLGSDLYARGALGYYASNGADYGVYGFGGLYNIGGAGGKSVSPLDTYIGLGIYGGVMGGWIKGNQYGAMLSGDRFGVYVDGKSITNDSYVVLNETKSNERTVSYATTALTVDVNAKGMGKLTNGTTQINFDEQYSALISEKKPIIVTVTPIGESNGIHLVSVNQNGFVVKENNNGNSNVSFTWIAIAEKETSVVSDEIKSNRFDHNMNGVMHNDQLDGATAVWSENGEIRFGKKAPFNTAKLKVKSLNKDTTITRTKK